MLPSPDTTRPAAKMKPVPHRCHECGADMVRDLNAGLTYCSACGHDAFPDHALPALDQDDTTDKRRWRVCFWLCLVLTPVAVLVFATGTAQVAIWQQRFGLGILPANALPSLGSIGILAFGLLGSGYCRMKFEKRYHDAADGFVQTIFHAGRVLFAYITFALCITVLWNLISNILHR